MSADSLEIETPTAVRLGSFDALLFAVVLETSLTQLRIIEGCSCNATAAAVGDDFQLSAHQEKLHRDRRTVGNIIRTTFAELLRCGRYTQLQDSLQNITQNGLLTASLVDQRTKLREMCKLTVHACQVQRAQHSRDVSEADMRIATLRDKVDDNAVNSTVRLSYVERWLGARAELLTMSAHAQPIGKYDSHRLQQEERVHNELLRAFDVAIEEYSTSLKVWEERYHRDIADINKRLSEERELLNETTLKRKRIQELFDLHAGEIKGWLTFKRERAARLERDARRNKAAVIISAWWRGVMVRRGLGAFKSLRGGKKQTKSGKQGKKNG